MYLKMKNSNLLEQSISRMILKFKTMPNTNNNSEYEPSKYARAKQQILIKIEFFISITCVNIQDIHKN